MSPGFSFCFISSSSATYILSLYAGAREIGNLLPNIQRQRCTCYALCHILYPVSAALTSIFQMDSNSTSYICRCDRHQAATSSRSPTCTWNACRAGRRLHRTEMRPPPRLDTCPTQAHMLPRQLHARSLPGTVTRTPKPDGRP